MELALLIIAGIGALLFVIGYLAYVFGGFKHHFVTGIISALPVLNIVTLPSLWHKSRGKIFMGTIGLIMLVSSWFLGADKSIPQLISGQKSNSTEKVILSSSKDISGVTNNSAELKETTSTQAQPARELNSDNLVALPGKALYTLAFESIPTNKINTLQGRIVRATLANNETIEGRLISVNPSSVFISGNVENELPITNIKELSLMVKKAQP